MRNLLRSTNEFSGYNTERKAYFICEVSNEPVKGFFKEFFYHRTYQFTYYKDLCNEDSICGATQKKVKHFLSPEQKNELEQSFVQLKNIFSFLFYATVLTSLLAVISFCTSQHM
jgi:hypothetical protein